MAQAAGVKQRLARQAGQFVDVHGQTLAAFPTPLGLLEVDELSGLPEVKVKRLHGVAQAALDHQLEADRLRTLPGEEALAELKRLSGVGDFSAELILVRGAGAPDHFPRHEQRLHAAMADAYGLGTGAPVDELEAIAERWRPYRSWVALLFRAGLEPS